MPQKGMHLFRGKVPDAVDLFPLQKSVGDMAADGSVRQPGELDM